MKSLLSIASFSVLLTACGSQQKQVEQATTQQEVSPTTYAETITEAELNGVIKKNESTILFSYVDNSCKALDLAVGELLGKSNLINSQISTYNNFSSKKIISEANNLFNEKKSITLFYGK